MGLTLMILTESIDSQPKRAQQSSGKPVKLCGSTFCCISKLWLVIQDLKISALAPVFCFQTYTGFNTISSYPSNLPVSQFKGRLCSVSTPSVELAWCRMITYLQYILSRADSTCEASCLYEE